MIEARVRAGYAAFNRGDFDEAATYFHREVELHRPGGLTPLAGAAALRAWMEPDAFAEQTIEPENDTWAVMAYDRDLLITRIETFMFLEEETAREVAGVPAAGSA